jgi:hypothetical protein
LHLRDLYGIDVSPDLISAVTDAVLDEIAAWRARPLDLEPAYPLVFFDALRVKIHDEGIVRNKAVHIALGVRHDGGKEIFGLWLEQNEGAKFWLRVMNELKNRGVDDVLLAVVDGLKGFPEAITAVSPAATVQTCIVHLLRGSLDFVSYKDRKILAAALKVIYRVSMRQRSRRRSGLRGRLLGVRNTPRSAWRGGGSGLKSSQASLSRRCPQADLFTPLVAAREIRAVMTGRGPLKPHFAGLLWSIHRSADSHHPAVCSEDEPDGS